MMTLDRIQKGRIASGHIKICHNPPPPFSLPPPPPFPIFALSPDPFFPFTLLSPPFPPPAEPRTQGRKHNVHKQTGENEERRDFRIDRQRGDATNTYGCVYIHVGGCNFAKWKRFFIMKNMPSVHRKVTLINKIREVQHVRMNEYESTIFVVKKTLIDLSANIED